MVVVVVVVNRRNQPYLLSTIVASLSERLCDPPHWAVPLDLLLSDSWFR